MYVMDSEFVQYGIFLLLSKMGNNSQNTFYTDILMTFLNSWGAN